MLGINNVLVAPINTEKSVGMSGKYTFQVHLDADKSLVKEAVNHFYGVDVVKVCIVNLKEKKKSGAKGKESTRRKGMKKAIITLKDGQTLNFNDFK